MDKKLIKSKLISLVNTFKDKKVNAWKRAEEGIQTQFTIPLLEFLGWEVKNIIINQGQETRSEKRPDILLKDDNGNTVFVIESKEARTKDKLDGSYGELKFDMQLNKYCKAEGKSWGILTNFVEWRVYSVDPKRLYEEKKYAFYDLLWENTEKSKYTDLLSDEGLEFFDKLSKDNLIREKGDWDKDRVYYKEQIDIEETKKTKELFFRNLKSWRSSLRTYINKKYSDIYQISDIDLVTQKILDRLIFIDYCYDNDVLPQDRLSSIIQSSANKWGLLKLVFDDMNKQFNSELFSNNEALDKLDIEDEIIVTILKGLNEIDFKKLPVHIIGEVYENYLGEMLKKNRGDFKVDESKEVSKKKSQGIYYTPDYIVKYIVDNTVGELLKKCNSREEISKIRVLDPACGSGSFLIQVFDMFLKHYKRVDGLKEEDNTAFDFEHYNKFILQNNIYGVDLDEKAVEITKLNLMIKALSGVTVANLENRVKLLPNLNLNIRCGNSLVSGLFISTISADSLFDNSENIKIYLSKLIILKEFFRKSADDKEKDKCLIDIKILEENINSILNKDITKYFKNIDRIKPFNYEVSFCDIFKDGGFDCVIGNPPYIRSKLLPDNDRKYYSDKFINAKGTYDIYILFIEKGFNLLNNTGKLGFINPNKYFYSDYGKVLRKHIASNYYISNILDFNEFQVFKGITTYTAINIFSKTKSTNYFNYTKVLNSNISLTEINDIINNNDSENSSRAKLLDSSLSKLKWSFSDNYNQKLLRKINSNSVKLIDLCYKIYQGFVLTPTEVFPISILSENEKTYMVKPIKKDENVYEIEKELVVQILKSSDLSRYYSTPKNYYTIFPYKYISKSKVEFVDLENMVKHFPLTLKYLENKKNYFLSREKGKWKNSPKWYEYSRKQNFECQKMRKILVPGLATEARYSLGNKNAYIDQGSYGIILKDGKTLNEKYILGLLNSKLLDFILKTISGTLSGGYYSYQNKYLSDLPIYNIDFNNKYEKEIHDRIIILVDEISELIKHPDINKIKIKSKESKIDELVFKLYGITNHNDLKIINNKLNKSI